MIDAVLNNDSVSSYTFVGVSGIHSIDAYYGIITNIISASVSTGGTISHLGTNIVNYGDTLAFTILPDSGYHLTHVFIDGVDSGIIYSHVFKNVTDVHTIHADFAINTYTITATANGGGTLTPVGVIPANWGDTKAFTIPSDSTHKYLRLIVDGDTLQTLPLSYSFSNIRANHSITAEFRPIITIYVSTTGADTGSGTIDNPLRSISEAMNRTYAEQVIFLNGIFVFGADNTGVGITNTIRPELTVTGSGLTFVKGIYVGGNNIYIKNIHVDSFGGSSSQGIMLLPLNNVTLENITINNFLNGVSQNTGSGIYTNLTANNISITSTASGAIGIQLFQGSNFHFDNISVSFPSLSSGSLGLIITGLSNSSFDDLTLTNCEFKSLWVMTASNISFNNGIITNSPVGIDLEATMGGSQIPGISNVSFTGNYLIRNVQSPISLISNNSNLPVFNASFNGKIKIRQTINPAVLITNYVIGSSFNGLDIDSCSGGIFIGGINAQGIVIRNCSLKTSPAISLNTNANNVDARYNDFPLAASFMDIHSFINDQFTNPILGLVDFTGSTWGLNPNITVQSVSNAYKGASYYLNVDLVKKTTDYNFIGGVFSYDTAKVQYLSNLSTGIMNNNGWNLIINGTTPGTISFTGFGPNAITASGTLFQLYMKVKSTAPDSIAHINGNPAAFMGNTNHGEFIINDDTIYYSAPTGPLQSRGDVTLDGVVDMNDFYALLFHLAGTVIITNPTALQNADFNQDGVVDVNDLNALYAFITGAPSAMQVGSGTVALSGASYNGSTAINIPVSINTCTNVRSLDLTLTYNPALINFQSFSKEVSLAGYSLIAFESTPGIAKFVFNSNTNLQDNLSAGAITLRFPNGSIPVGSVISTSYRINGQKIVAGPTLTLNSGEIVLAVNEAGNTIPTKFNLYQNYPNPFNPSTIIRYDIPKSSAVRIMIYDILGREVRTLVNEQKAPGSYSVQWKGDDNSGYKVSSGIYLYMIKSGDYVNTRKMIIMK